MRKASIGAADEERMCAHESSRAQAIARLSEGKSARRLEPFGEH